MLSWCGPVMSLGWCHPIRPRRMRRFGRKEREKIRPEYQSFDYSIYYESFGLDAGKREGINMVRIGWNRER